ncbi:helix-turn-helix domain-containing protein [Streptomyces althioticus]|jgi:transcriptional regulator with XRE-family HTH domain|uniref:Helix-turn-helix domain-containing protein n=1 Tax=Streptomyces althioticus TaxID=83380 RepID=A0ABZ1Y0D2_9ACTN|nr:MULTISPECIES: helix-turn-helix transcriptional regulator [Actinomycetes]WTB44969.1 helix-turn-helix domain-containing protein [Streptomyces althioticus]GGQ48814.1 transcriptional regulator [Streptomyces griseorubens]GGT39918.1 transcriptional regulator [Streptomyces matensis]MBM4826907.1 helix-turn-helix domain-containing protein [Actinospica acidiphila]WTB96450.1 helix-turn-helix domain-containing protein [Streptomyces althioticus]
MSAASHRISRLEPYLDRPEPAPTLLKMLVGVQLAGFREDAGLSQDQAARSVGFSGAKLSRIESGKGRRPPTETDVRALLELYGTDDYEASVLLKLLQRAGEPGWWQRYDKRLMPEWFDRLVGLQEAAATIRTFEIQYVPGLLQTADYTRAVVERGLPNAPASEVQRRVELRMRRAQLLLREDAPQLWAVIDESVLLRVLGDRTVMRDQLDHLARMAERTNVTLQIVPLNVTNASAPAIPVTYLRFGGLDLPDVVYLEHIRSANFLEDRDETEEYRIVLDRLADEALTPRESVEMLRRTIDERYALSS